MLLKLLKVFQGDASESSLQPGVLEQSPPEPRAAQGGQSSLWVQFAHGNTGAEVKLFQPPGCSGVTDSERRETPTGSPPGESLDSLSLCQPGAFGGLKGGGGRFSLVVVLCPWLCRSMSSSLSVVPLRGCAGPVVSLWVCSPVFS